MAKRRIVKLKGLETVMKNLTKEVKKIKTVSMRGLLNAAIIIHRDTDQTPPKIPIDWGNLRASKFTTSGYSNQAGGGKFKGPGASKLTSDHESVVSSAASKALKSRKSKKPIVILGYSANYAAMVHETTAAKQWKRAGSGPKFFETSLKNNTQNVVDAIKLANAKRK